MSVTRTFWFSVGPNTVIFMGSSVVVSSYVGVQMSSSVRTNVNAYVNGLPTNEATIERVVTSFDWKSAGSYVSVQTSKVESLSAKSKLMKAGAA